MRCPRLTVLVTDANYKHALGLIRSLGRRRVKVCCVSHYRLAPGFFSRCTRRSKRVPSPDNSPAGYRAALRALIGTWRVDLLIPVGYSSVAAVASDPDLHAKTVAPDEGLFERASDKWAMVEVARAAGLSVPQTALIGKVEDVHHFLDQRMLGGDPRIVVKARREGYGKGASYVASAAECEQVMQPYASAGSTEPTVIAQEYVEGNGAGYFALAWRGRVVREFMHRRRREWPPEGGFATAAESIYDEHLARDGRALIAALGWHGPAMVEFRVNARGRYFIEFNPKFWGSLDLALACGADFPGDLCRLTAGEDLTGRACPPYDVGRRIWWPWRGDLRRLRHRPHDWRAVLADCCNPRVRSNWRWTDPLPNLIEIGAELTRPWRRTAQ
ncbi:MAG TPA: hypothetical protein VM118_13130 [Acidobacteriota bacterium]|nr:hypothetical protein [Acidobacteriota bacterium]